MNTGSNRKILGAFIIGLALVGGAYTLATFNTPSYQQPATAIQPEVPPRTPIAVVDSDNNGIEDWRDTFVTTEPVVLTETTNATTYNQPDTLTGQVGVQFIQNILETRIYTENPAAEEQVIEATINQLETETSGTLYDPTAITVIMDWDDTDVVNYANIMGNSLTENSLSGLEGELQIMEDILRREKRERVSDLALIAEYYETIRDEALRTPVPRELAKEHLDLINTYHAVAIDIRAMSQVLEDPLVALMRMRQYEDDSLGLRLALENMYLALLPYANQFNGTDAAVVFTLFAPEQRI